MLLHSISWGAGQGFRGPGVRMESHFIEKVFLVLPVTHRRTCILGAFTPEYFSQYSSENVRSDQKNPELELISS